MKGILGKTLIVTIILTLFCGCINLIGFIFDNDEEEDHSSSVAGF